MLLCGDAGGRRKFLQEYFFFFNSAEGRRVCVRDLRVMQTVGIVVLKCTLNTGVSLAEVANSW